jgi:CMP-N-acetylneuraminate monooxygenase
MNSDVLATRNLIATFELEELAAKPVWFLADKSIIVYRDESGLVRACYNRCKHRSGCFIPPSPHQGEERPGVVKCANHGWKLDLARMRYVDPLGKLYQSELEVELIPALDGTTLVNIYDNAEPLPWEIEPQTRQELVAGEFTTRFYSHATVEINCGGPTLFTDPWLVGPSSTRGWWLTHRPPADWLARLVDARGVYISHTHSDHLHLPTLRLLSARRPDIPIFYPDFPGRTGLRLLRQAGLTNITLCRFNRWYYLSQDARFMLFEDSTGKDDSGLLVEYKGHRLLNTVDASAGLNHSSLPRPVDMLLTAFAGGAGGHPVCWREQYSEEQIEARVNRNLQAEARHALLMAEQTEPQVLVPFAGYFEVAHPADAEIKSLNRKNKPEDICRMVRDHYPEIQTWLPHSGQTFDLATRRAETPPTPDEPPDYDFDSHLVEMRAALDFAPLQTLQGIRRYFKWAGYRGDLVLQIIETDESFKVPLREFWLDFSEPDLLVSGRPARPHRYMRMKVRAEVFRFVLKNCLPWEEISVGFQARFYREPDIYSYEFWHHFQFELPAEPLDWQTT